VNDNVTDIPEVNDFDDRGVQNSVTEGQPSTYEYLYDDAGSLVEDKHKDLNITYNDLSKPRQMTWTNVNNDDFTMNLTYDGTGGLLRKELWKNDVPFDTIEYMGSIQYDGGKLDVISVPQGRAIPTCDGEFRYDYYYTDHLGNIRLWYSDLNGDGEIKVQSDGNITHCDGTSTTNGEILQEQHYYPYGLTMGGLKYTSDVLTLLSYGRDPHLYTAKELTEQDLNLYNFGARWYDMSLGRWMVHDPEYQFASPYLAMGNNPVSVTDPDGRFAFVPVLVGMAYGALIGAGTSAAMYATTTAISGAEWDWNAFGRATAFGAVGGALGGGLGALGGQLGSIGQSLGYNVLSNVASNSATTLAFGGDVTAGGAIGMVAAGMLGAGIGGFNGVKGSALKNIGAELGFRTLKGGFLGAYGGALGASIDGRDVEKSMLLGAKYGAISGATSAGLNIAIMGAAYKPNRTYGNFENGKPVYRRGTFLTKALFSGSGAAFGRNLVVNKLNENYRYKDPDTGWEIDVNKYNQMVEAHETGHFQQQEAMGFANFYGKVIYEYIKYGRLDSYCTPGTLEWDADRYAIDRVGNFYK
jgi:RHS repeat-associated protein